VIGFLDEALPGRTQTASQMAFYNSQRERQWGVSSRDREAVVAAILAGQTIVTQSQFGGDIDVAVRSPSVRQLVMLYSEASGRRSAVGHHALRREPGGARRQALPARHLPGRPGEHLCFESADPRRDL
jgi:hypothetical protein